MIFFYWTQCALIIYVCIVYIRSYLQISSYIEQEGGSPKKWCSMTKHGGGVEEKIIFVTNGVFGARDQKILHNYMSSKCQQNITNKFRVSWSEENHILNNLFCLSLKLFLVLGLVITGNHFDMNQKTVICLMSCRESLKLSWHFATILTICSGLDSLKLPE